MAIFKRASSQALVLGGLLLAGCAEGGDNIFTTGSLSGQPKVDPACVTLAADIGTLRKEGIPDKVEKAAARRYRLTRADLKKVAQLTKASTDFQGRCSTLPPAPATAEAPAASSKAPAASSKAAPKKTAKAGKAASAD